MSKWVTDFTLPSPAQLWRHNLKINKPCWNNQKERGTAMKTDKEYNGWTNYETWSTNLYLDSYFYDLVGEQVSAIVKNNADLEPDDREPVTVYAIADMLSSDFDDTIMAEAEELLNRLPSGGLLLSLLRADKIDWHEIADNIVTSVVDSYDPSERPEIQR